MKLLTCNPLINTKSNLTPFRYVQKYQCRLLSSQERFSFVRSFVPFLWHFIVLVRILGNAAASQPQCRFRFAGIQPRLTQLHMETLAFTSVFVFVYGNHVNRSLSSLADSIIFYLAIECSNWRGSPSQSTERYIRCIDSFTFVSCIVFWSLLCCFGCPSAIVRRMMGCTWYQSCIYKGWHSTTTVLGGTIR